MPIAAASNANQKSSREREGSLCASGSGRARQWPAVIVRDFWLFVEVVCLENWAVTLYSSGCSQRDFLKVELKHAGQGPHAQLPSQQRDKIEV